MRPFLNSTDAIGNGSELQKRLQRDGYLFIQNLLPRQSLEELKVKWLQILSSAGWLRQDRPLEEGIADINAFCLEPQDQYMDVLHRVYELKEFHALQHHLKLVGLFESMWKQPIIPHPRLIGRVIFPQREEYTTPPHQDFIPVQGSDETYAVWFPLTDLDPEMGGLQVASGSHTSGIYEFRPALGAGGLEIIDTLGGTWVGNPFKQGDVLVFHCMTAHKGIPNRGDRLRLSVDARYQRMTDPIAPDSLEPHGKLITWEKLYVDWPKDDPLKYYWRRWNLRVKEYDTSYHEKRDCMAFDMAALGDKRSISALERITSRDAVQSNRRKAWELLKALECRKNKESDPKPT